MCHMLTMETLDNHQTATYRRQHTGSGLLQRAQRSNGLSLCKAYPETTLTCMLSSSFSRSGIDSSTRLKSRCRHASSTSV